jgi:gas vesicle protein
LSRSDWKYVVAALGGSVVGFGVGLLLAPASGAETRRRLNEKVTREADVLRRRGRRAIEDLGDLASEKVEQGKQQLAELLHR